MDDKKKQRLADDLEKFNKTMSYRVVLPSSQVPNIKDMHAVGMRLQEGDGCFYVFHPDYREVIPITPDIPDRMNRPIRSGVFSFTLNREFTRVMDECAKPRDDKGTWIGNMLRRQLIDLHTRGFAHSVDVYRDGRLDGGILGLTNAGTFVGLSVFRTSSHAGNMAGVALKAVLWKHNFSLFDASSPSTFSRNFHGVLMPRWRYLQLRDQSMRKPVTFPKIPDKISIADYTKPLTNG